MLPQQVLITLFLALSVSALPLNINLGAFSPAFVVGDGEISLDGDNAGELMETLSSGAAAAADTQTGTQEAAGTSATIDTSEASQASPSEAPSSDNSSKKPAKEDGKGDDAKATVLGLNADGVIEASSPNLKRSPEAEPIVDTDLSTTHSSSSAPALRLRSKSRRSPEANEKLKRDLAGFRTALNFAKEAMKNQPEVELGTGEGGSGVGVIVNPGLNVPADSAAAGAKAKRDVEGAEEKMGITLLAIAEV